MNDGLTPLDREVLARQPFSVALKACLVDLRHVHAELSIPFASMLTQEHGQVPGGVLAQLSGNALTFAGGSVFGGAITVETVRKAA